MCRFQSSLFKLWRIVFAAGRVPGRVRARLCAGITALDVEAVVRENPSMYATIIDKKRRMTLPEPVCEAAGLKPNDQVEWRVEAGEIRGRRRNMPTF